MARGPRGNQLSQRDRAADRSARRRRRWYLTGRDGSRGTGGGSSITSLTAPSRRRPGARTGRSSTRPHAPHHTEPVGPRRAHPAGRAQRVHTHRLAAADGEAGRFPTRPHAGMVAGEELTKCGVRVAGSHNHIVPLLPPVARTGRSSTRPTPPPHRTGVPRRGSHHGARAAGSTTAPSVLAAGGENLTVLDPTPRPPPHRTGVAEEGLTQRGGAAGSHNRTVPSSPRWREPGRSSTRPHAPHHTEPVWPRRAHQRGARSRVPQTAPSVLAAGARTGRSSNPTPRPHHTEPVWPRRAHPAGARAGSHNRTVPSSPPVARTDQARPDPHPPPQPAVGDERPTSGARAVRSHNHPSRPRRGGQDRPVPDRHPTPPTTPAVWR